jgi:ABC-type transporter Mla maintaining outer membrane lipid asymmetry ATPase subunit MlaF
VRAMTMTMNSCCTTVTLERIGGSKIVLIDECTSGVDPVTLRALVDVDVGEAQQDYYIHGALSTKRTFSLTTS